MKKYLGTLVFGLLPLSVSAHNIQNIPHLFEHIFGWISASIPLLVAVVLAVIFWNLGQFILHAGEERERERYKQFMVWSVVAMFLLLSFWGVVYFLVGSFFTLGSAGLNTPGYVDKNGTTVTP